jgi:hypothetical protein
VPYTLRRLCSGQALLNLPLSETRDEAASDDFEPVAEVLVDQQGAVLEFEKHAAPHQFAKLSREPGAVALGDTGKLGDVESEWHRLVTAVERGRRPAQLPGTLEEECLERVEEGHAERTIHVAGDSVESPLELAGLVGLVL